MAEALVSPGPLSARGRWGAAFLWHAQLTPVSDGRTAEIGGTDLVLLRGDKLCRNEVYFERMALFGSRARSKCDPKA